MAETFKSKILTKEFARIDKLLEVKTTHTAAYREVIDRISNIITDCSIVFIPNDDDDCNHSNNNDDDDYYECVYESDLSDNN